MELKEKFKKFGGDFIPDIIEYIKSFIEKNPSVTISVGCDSIQKKKRTVYAVAIMLYNTDIKSGAHVVFFRESITKVKDNFERLQKESQYVLEIGEFLNKELEDFYNRNDLSIQERKRYKYHLAKCRGEYLNTNDETSSIRCMLLTENEKVCQYKLVDLHLDFNPFEGKMDNRGYARNRSHLSYKTYVPWLRGMGYRVWVKPLSFSASCAADLLVQD